jgi:hypothetical protein
MALDLGSLSSDFLKTQLGTAQGLQTGTTQPWQTPEFQSLANNLSKGFMNQRSELEKVMSQKGITGGASAEMFNNLNSQDMSAKLNAINQIRQHYGELGTGIANQDLARQMDEWKTRWDELFKQQQFNTQTQLTNLQRNQQASEFIKNLHLQDEMAKRQQFQSSMTGMSGAVQGGGGGSGGCCFIFIQGELLTDNVRMFRDEMFPKGGIVENGYRKMAKWLVPLMARNWFVLKNTEMLMLKPICSIANHYYGYNSYGWIFTPIGHFWKKVWERMGK